MHERRIRTMTGDNATRHSRQAGLSALLLVAAGTLLLATFEKPHTGATGLPALPTGDVEARKAAFFEFLRPIVRHHNERIRDERDFVQSIESEDDLGWLERRSFERLARRYDVDLGVLAFDDALELLKRRIDVIPPGLVLIQAAKESGWGRSRFAREGNALFGEWCFRAGCGMVPGQRTPGRSHEVRSFRTVHDSVGSYMNNINSNRSYRELRLAREQMRAENSELSSLSLADYLSRYSERGQAYVREIRTMIRQNGLEDE